MLSTRTGPERRRAARRRARGIWRLCVALFAALSFVLLVSTAATHQHTSALAAHDCALCAAVADQLASAPVVPVPVLVLQLLQYLVFSVAAYLVVYLSPTLLPPGRGPPQASAF